MKKISPSWINWDVGSNNFPDQVKPPNVNKKQGQDAEEADFKSASKPQVHTNISTVNGKTTTKELINDDYFIRVNKRTNKQDVSNPNNTIQPTHTTHLYQRPEECDKPKGSELRTQENKFKVEQLLSTWRKNNNKASTQFKRTEDTVERNKNKAFKRSSAKPTREYRKFTKAQLQDNREQADYHKENNWKLNPRPVSSDFSMKDLRNRKLGSTLALLFSKIAEERMGEKTIGSDKWDIEQIMFRRVSKKLITNCKYTREKQKVIIMLDSSPSCSRMANLYSQISTEACKYEDVELYDAPNGYAHSRYCPSERKYISLSNEEIDMTYLWSGFEDRTIIYFGDRDAVRSIESACSTNEVHWFFQGSRHYSDGDLKEQVNRIRRIYGDRVNVYSANTVDEIIRAVRDIK